MKIKDLLLIPLKIPILEHFPDHCSSIIINAKNWKFSGNETDLCVVI